MAIRLVLLEYDHRGYPHRQWLGKSTFFVQTTQGIGGLHDRIGSETAATLGQGSVFSASVRCETLIGGSRKTLPGKHSDKNVSSLCSHSMSSGGTTLKRALR